MLIKYLSGSGGRWGGADTRLQNHFIATQYEKQGVIIQGAGRQSEEWIPGVGGALKGGTFVDITIRDGNKVTRIQTISVKADGTPTLSEAAAAARIRSAFPNDELILIPKVKK